jgi:predicted ATPase
LVPATPLVGRDRELRELAGILLGGEARLVTLTGPGGTGKTRLAAEFAARHGGGFRDGVCLVPLAPLGTADVVPAAVASELDVRDRPDRPLAEAVADRLRSHEMLLVLDNFEHVLDAAGFAGRLLSAASELRVLVTSREPLRIAGEREFRVPPLTTVDPDGARDDPRAVSSVRLFIERAQAVRHDFTPSPDELRAIATICHRLDGLPLAIELAAARMRILAPEALATRLTSRLGMLTGGPRDAPARQRTLRDAIAWSYDLLEPDEKVLFRRLAVFAGRFELDDAEAVAQDAGTLDRISSLVEKSLVASDGRRLWMLQTIREYALERLAGSGEEHEVNKRHAEHVVRVAEEAAKRARSGGRLEWLSRLDAMLDDIRAVMGWTTDAEEPELAVRLVGAVAQHGWIRGRGAETLAWCRSALRMSDGVGDPAVRAAGLEALALTTAMTLPAPAPDGVAAARQLQELADRSGDPAVRARALFVGGALSAQAGEVRRARALTAQAAELARSHGDVYTLAQSLANLGDIEISLGQPEAAQQALAEGLPLCEQAGLVDMRGVLLLNLGAARRALGDIGGARMARVEALAAAGLVKWPWLAIYSLIGLARLEDDPRRAARLIGAVDRLRRELGIPLQQIEAAEHEEALAAVRKNLEPEELEREYQAGAGMSLEEAAAYAGAPRRLGDLTDPRRARPG